MALSLPHAISNRTVMLLVSALLLAACATTEPEGPPARETVWALSIDHQLIKFNAGQPRRVLERRPVVGLAPGEGLVGIDYRVVRGVLYAFSDQGRLYTLDTASGALRLVGAGAAAAGLLPGPYGFDFNPAADRIRVVNVQGQNLRLHPDTGAAVDADPATAGFQPDGKLAYAAGDVNQGQVPQVVAAGYTYNTRNDKITTNFAIDRRLGVLVVQGSREGVEPVVSPNLGRLFTVGSLGLGPLHDASLDISDVGNVALAALSTASGQPTRLYRIDLANGRATLVGQVGRGGALRGLAIEP